MKGTSTECRCAVISFAMSSGMTWEQSDGSLSNWKRNTIVKLKAQQLSVRIALYDSFYEQSLISIFQLLVGFDTSIVLKEVA